MKSFKDWGLLPKVLIAIALGIICSFFFPDWLTRVFVTFNGIFSNFLGLIIPILILGLIAPGIFELGKGAGRLLLITAAIAYLSTILSGLFSYGTCRLAYPSLLGDAAVSLGNIDMSAHELKPFFTIEMPSVMSVTTALVLAFVLGLTLIHLEGDTLRNAMRELREVIFSVIRKVIIPLLPLFIFGIFLKMGAEGNVGPVLGMFLKIILIIFLMHVTVLVLQFCIAGAIAGRNPFKALVTMLPAYVTALGTQSSAATIPSFATYAGFILMLGITMIAAPGVPGGAIMAALGLLASMLGFDPSMQGLMIALYIAMDSFGTAGNVTGDGAIALIINKIKLKNGNAGSPESSPVSA